MLKNSLLLSVLLLVGVSSSVALSASPLEAIQGKLVNAQGESAPASALENKPMIALYYSAHWCPPCRKFTPKLVDLYQKSGGGERFEVVLISSDRSEKDMLRYMTEAGMPWLALEYDSIANSGLRGGGGPYIPSMLLLDGSGEVIASSYDEASEEFKGADSVLKVLQQKLAEKP
jgi:nucleoredoxin